MGYKTEFRRIGDIGDCKGKTIEEATDTVSGFGLRFTDRTFYFAEADDEGIYSREPSLMDALDLGIIDVTEYDRARDEQRQAEVEAERQEYERLKAKFEAKATGLPTP